jgi:hypothetical protein
VEVAIVWLNLIGYFSPIVPPFADRGLSRQLTWSASGDERVKLKRSCTISLERLQYIRWVTAGPTQKKKTKGNGTCLEILLPNSCLAHRSLQFFLIIRFYTIAACRNATLNKLIMNRKVRSFYQYGCDTALLVTQTSLSEFREFDRLPRIGNWIVVLFSNSVLQFIEKSVVSPVTFLGSASTFPFQKIIYFNCIFRRFRKIAKSDY